MRSRVIKFSILWLFLGIITSAAQAGVPDWLRAAAQQPQKKYADDDNAVMLLDEQETSVNDRLEIVNHHRIAYRILRPEGKDFAHCAIPFSGETKISYFRGWSITAKGIEYEVKDRDAFERNISTYEVFEDLKEKILLVPGADVGTVVGIEYEQKGRPYVFEDRWEFQRELPVEKSRYTLYLPPGWEYRAEWINHPDQKPTERGGVFTWEVNDVPRIYREPHRLPQEALAGQVVITFFSERVKDLTFATWNDLGRWHARLYSTQRDTSPSLEAKVKELAPPSASIFDRIRALSLFAQRDVRYAAIEVGIGGWQPHAASTVFEHRYGDCKDKANVLSSMLAQIGIHSFLMPVNDKRGIFNAKTPPNLGFNHVIIAIQIPDGYPKDFQAVVEHPKLGHLLIFDPTNDFVPLGQLPSYEQDSYALLVRDNGGELLHLPVSSPESNAVQRTVRARLEPDGTLRGEITETYSGYQAMMHRAYLRDESQNDRKKILQYFTRNAGDFQIDDFELQNVEDITKSLVVKYKFTASHYAKNAGPLVLLRPRVVGEMAGAFNPSKPRHYDYEFPSPFSDVDSFEITLPDGYKVDELPDPAKKVVPFAEYTSKAEASGNVLKYSREYKMTTTLVPLEKMDLLKSLFGQINMDEKNMAILKKAN